jgi:hypothetical protein
MSCWATIEPMLCPSTKTGRPGCSALMMSVSCANPRTIAFQPSSPALPAASIVPAVRPWPRWSFA